MSACNNVNHCVVRHPNELPANIHHSDKYKNQPTRPYAIFSTWQGTQTPTQSQPCQELIMPRPHAHPPPSGLNSYRHLLKYEKITTISNPQYFTTSSHCDFPMFST